MVIVGTLDEHGRDPAEDDEGAHHHPEDRAALLALAALEGVAAVTGLAIGSVVSLRVDESSESSQRFRGLETDESSVGSDETTNERLGRKLGVLIALERMERLDADLGRRGHLLDSDPSPLALLSEKLTECEVLTVGGAQGMSLKCPIACSATFVLGKRLLTSTNFLRARSYCLPR